MAAVLCDSVPQGSVCCLARAPHGISRTGLGSSCRFMAWVNVPALARERCAISLRRSPSSSHKIEHFSSSQAVAASEWSFLGGRKRVCLCMPPTGLSFGRGVTATRKRLLVFVANASQPEKPEGEGDDDEAGEKSGPDWDSAWSAFKKEVRNRTALPDMESYVSRPPPSQRLQKPPPFANQAKSSQRQQGGNDFQTERRALGAWTDEKFTVIGFGVLFAVFIYMVVIIGPPPPR